MKSVNKKHTNDEEEIERNAKSKAELELLMDDDDDTETQGTINNKAHFNMNEILRSEKEKQQLIKSIEKFNLAEIPAINKDNTIISGHQRIKALQLIGRGEEMIDVRVPNRQLTRKEVKEYNLISNTHAGEWDFEILEVEFEDVKIEEIWNFDIPGFDMPTNEAVKNVAEKEERKAAEYDPNKQWFLNIRCETEQHAQELYEQFLEQGLDVKIVS